MPSPVQMVGLLHYERHLKLSACAMLFASVECKRKLRKRMYKLFNENLEHWCAPPVYVVLTLTHLRARTLLHLLRTDMYKFSHVLLTHMPHSMRVMFAETNTHNVGSGLVVCLMRAKGCSERRAFNINHTQDVGWGATGTRTS